MKRGSESAALARQCAGLLIPGHAQRGGPAGGSYGAAYFHGLGPFWANAASGGDSTSLPLARQQHQESIVRGLALTRSLLRILGHFKGSGIAVMPVKGPTLAEAAYGPAASLRTYDDIDLFVRPSDLSQAIRLLNELGYTLDSPLPLRHLIRRDCEVPLRGQSGEAIDLHWHVAPPDYPFRFDPQILWMSPTAVRIGGHEVACPSPEPLLLYLCVHGTKHYWYRLIWLCDISLLIAKGIRWERALELARDGGCTRPLLLGLVLAHLFFQAEVPASLLELASADPALVLAEGEVAALLDAQPPRKPGAFEIVRFNARLATGYRKKLRHYAMLLQAPTEADVQALRLPAGLYFLYHVIRPARLSWKYAHRLAAGLLR